VEEPILRAVAMVWDAMFEKGVPKPEHFKKAQAEGKMVSYSNHNPDQSGRVDQGGDDGAVAQAQHVARVDGGQHFPGLLDGDFGVLPSRTW
jgi:hypothetical protein